MHNRAAKAQPAVPAPTMTKSYDVVALLLGWYKALFVLRLMVGVFKDELCVQDKVEAN